MRSGRTSRRCSTGPQPSAAWAVWAQESGYRVGLLADKLGRSARWLELYFQRTWCLTPHDWLARLRAQAIEALARAGLPAKVICGRVGLADAASLSHRLKSSHCQPLHALRRPWSLRPFAK